MVQADGTEFPWYTYAYLTYILYFSPFQSKASDASKLNFSTKSLEETQESPDLFSQGEFEESLKEIKAQEDSPQPNTSKPKVPNNSRLFEEMGRLDEQSGRLNLSVPHTSPFKITGDVISTDGNAAMDTSAVTCDATAELKKKVSRKITDYFCKK